MSTLTSSANGQHKNPQYKDYIAFLDTYRNGKKDDQNSVVTSDSGVNFSLNSSANNSSTSVFSDVSDGSGPQGKPPKAKSEIFIEIKDPTDIHTKHVFPMKNFQLEITRPSKGAVGKTAKMFDSQAKAPSMWKRQRSFRQNSIEEIAKKFEGSSQCSNGATLGKPALKRTSSIGKVSQVFENQQPKNSDFGTQRRPKNFNSVPKPFQSQTFTSEVKSKPLILSPKPTLTQTQNFHKFIPEPPASYADSVDSALSSLSISPSPPQCASPPPPSLPAPPLPPIDFKPLIFIQKKQEILSPRIDGCPPPPPPPSNFIAEPVNHRDLMNEEFRQKFNKKAESGVKKTLARVEVQKPSEFSAPPAPMSPPPPPPPLPSANTTPSPQQHYIANQRIVVNTSTSNKQAAPMSPPPPPPPMPSMNCTPSPKQHNIANQRIVVNTSTSNMQANNGTIDRNDPRVKKAVYGALRHMYGTYHDQANDYLATLPKYKVKKNNGLDKIIDSIASQGGLDKLSGRANPKQDME